MAIKKDKFQLLFEQKVLTEERMGIWQFITSMEDGEQMSDHIGAKSKEEALERYKKEFLPAYGGLDNIKSFKLNPTYADQGYDFEIEFRELDMEDPYYETFEKMIDKEGELSEESSMSSNKFSWNDDTLEHFQDILRSSGYGVLNIEVDDFVSSDVAPNLEDGETEEEAYEDLMRQVLIAELTRYYRLADSHSEKDMEDLKTFNLDDLRREWEEASEDMADVKDMMSEETTQSDILDSAYSEVAGMLTDYIFDTIEEALDNAGMDSDNSSLISAMVERLISDLQGGE